MRETRACTGEERVRMHETRARTERWGKEGAPTSEKRACTDERGHIRVRGGCVQELKRSYMSSRTHTRALGRA
jgi:hypothetical protein